MVQCSMSMLHGVPQQWVSTKSLNLFILIGSIVLYHSTVLFPFFLCFEVKVHSHPPLVPVELASTIYHF